jgi:uncharacterized membrane protein YeaQ/YmgE (transglycosylase-associated protein family)
MSPSVLSPALAIRKWVSRYRAEGLAGLQDRSSRPHQLRRPTSQQVVQKIEQLRRQRWTGEQIATEVDVSPATVSPVSRRLGLNKLSILEPEAPQLVRRVRSFGEPVSRFGRRGTRGAWLLNPVHFFGTKNAGGVYPDRRGAIIWERSMENAGVGWVAAIIIGGLAGWLAEKFMKSEMGLFMNIVLGIVGAVVASAILSWFGITLAGWIGYLIAGFVGACVLIWIVRAFKKA